MSRVRVLLALLLPMGAGAASEATPVICDIPNPCKGVAAFELRSCAEAKADWIVEGRYSIDRLGILTVERASALKGEPPLLDSNYGKFLQWRSCWGIGYEPAPEVRVYGHSSRGIFAALPPPVKPHPYATIP